MFVELIESLRCPNQHDESPLVVTASRTDARHILEGTLGCPVCRAEFPIHRGEALFGGPSAVEGEGPDAEAALRIAGFLELTDARGFAILCGRWAAQAEAVRLLSATPLMLINPPRRAAVQATGVIRARGRVPLAPESARAAAIDDAADDMLVASVVAAVRPGGRIIGPASMPMPAGIAEITRDATTWVGAKNEAPDGPAPRLIRLRKA